jgi:type IV secretion system protein VirD4
MMKSAERQADAERSLDRILTLFDDTPAKKRAVKKVQKDIASAFSDK